MNKKKFELTYSHDNSVLHNLGSSSGVWIKVGKEGWSNIGHAKDDKLKDYWMHHWHYEKKYDGWRVPYCVLLFCEKNFLTYIYGIAEDNSPYPKGSFVFKLDVKKIRKLYENGKIKRVLAALSSSIPQKRSCLIIPRKYLWMKAFNPTKRQNKLPYKFAPKHFEYPPKPYQHRAHLNLVEYKNVEEVKPKRKKKKT